MSENFKVKIGRMIQDQRLNRQMTQSQLAAKVGTSQSAINRIEKGRQNISLEMLARISEVLDSDIISLNSSRKISYVIRGGRPLSGTIDVKTSKNAAVALLCASLLNSGKTTLRRLAKIEEVNRIIEVLNSIGVATKWLGNDLEVNPPKRLKLENIDFAAAKRTRSIIMFLGPLLSRYHDFKIPFAGGCNLGKRTVEPHLQGLEPFGLSVDAVCDVDYYHVHSTPQSPTEPIVLTERGNTTTENVIMAAALTETTTVIKNASNDYMVLDLCHYLTLLGVKIDGVGTNTLTITGLKSINKSVVFTPSEDPIEAISLIAAGIMTNSEITISGVPIDFIDIELAILRSMGLKYRLSKVYKSRNNFTNLVDLSLLESSLTAPKDKLTTFPSSVNMDNLPFLALIAAKAEGRTLVHDWPYENRAIYLTELTKLGAEVELLDPHRVWITGPTRWKAADMVAPPALRPSVVILLAMLAASGESILRDVYNIQRGYQDLPQRLNALGADIQTI
ncbi:MAG: UDP-N-acetylglucosamine 1-carboxyvinyltransferase [Candidatus Nomurabacteria bacterium]|jgi:UDP-N-acetylglucosamine 1-carboxyvinyltransferase|nr:UDP-N-acetylglucosamine 1-carboxyvinyltransferase [Candidatus Nomurabacteria bacterium]